MSWRCLYPKSHCDQEGKRRAQALWTGSCSVATKPREESTPEVTCAFGSPQWAGLCAGVQKEGGDRRGLCSVRQQHVLPLEACWGPWVPGSLAVPGAPFTMQGPWLLGTYLLPDSVACFPGHRHSFGQAQEEAER